MSLPLVLTDEATAEFDEAVAWLESNGRSPQTFIKRVQKSLDQIGERPEMHRIVLDNIRRAVVQRTSYSIFYRIQRDRIEVFSVFHGSRDPSQWQKRG